MAQQELQSRFGGDGDGPSTWKGSYGVQHDEPSLGDLLKRLSSDMGELMSQEIALAKAELRESATNIGKGVTGFTVAWMFAMTGLIAVTAFLIVGLGSLTGGYAWWALGIGVLELIVAAVAADSGRKAMRPSEIKPDETIDTLREDKQWAKREMKDLKRDLTANPPSAR